MKTAVSLALICAIASPVTSASNTHRSRSQAAPAPLQHAAVHHRAQHRAVRTPVGHPRPDHRTVAPRGPALVRYVLPAVRVASARSLILPQRVVAVPVPYYVVESAPPVQEIITAPSAGFPPDWNWRPVESFAALAPRANSSAALSESQVRYYCPDTREYFPAVETCDSSWLKVIP